MERNADVFAQLADELHSQETFVETLDVLVASAPVLVGGDAAGVLLSRRGSYLIGPDTDGSASKADALQVECKEGPAITAITVRRDVLVHDLANDPRWPEWGPRAADLGYRSALSVRLWTEKSTLGALTFYAFRLRAFDSDAVAVAEIIGRHASIALSSARQEESLAQAIDTRKLVGQAQGILMERYDLDDRRAFDVLRRFSQAQNLRLNEVARILVTTRQLPAKD
jgi:GAF domain-containing protein